MKDFKGTILFTSRDHALTESVANRIIEITPKGIIDKLMSYDEVVADYMMKSRSKENSGKLAVELFKLKTKATKLLNKGINEDGSKIRYSNIGMGSALGDVFMNEFSGQRGIKASEMPSWDLNKAFSEYFHGALWNSGNGIFTGFKEMLPVFDGIIANSYEKNRIFHLSVDYKYREVCYTL